MTLLSRKKEYLSICIFWHSLEVANQAENNGKGSVDIDVVSHYFYYGVGNVEVLDLTVTPYGEQYYGIPADIPGKTEGTMTVIDYGPWPGNTPELGVMMIGNGDRGGAARGGSTQATEALLFTPNP